MKFIEVPYFKYAKQYRLWELKNKNKNIKLKIYDGISGSNWNGGRIQEYYNIPKKQDVSFALTRHSNIDFNDKITLDVLEKFNKKGNSIILSNIKLTKMLQSKFKNYDYIFSITAYDISNGFSGYKELEKMYDYIVPRNEIFKNLDNFKDLNIKQYVALFSYECAECPLYNQHYSFIGDIKKGQEHLAKCWFKDKNLFKETPYNADDYDYTVVSSIKWNNNTLKLPELAGYKIGRNFQSWEDIEIELNEIVQGITND